MKPRITITGQRNPFVAFARFRKAGPHAKTTKALRRQAVMALARLVKSSPEYRPKDVPMRVFLSVFRSPLMRKWSARLSEEQEVAVRFGGEAPFYGAVAERLKASVCKKEQSHEYHLRASAAP